jgi:hypothetical protein
MLDFKKIFYTSVLKCFFVVFAAVIITPSTAQAKNCPDDPRMNDLARATQAKLDGQSVPPLTLSAQTYLSMNANLRKAWGKDVVLLDAQCNKMNMAGGQPVMKVEKDFGVLFSAFFDAVMKKDQDTADIILSAFKAKPLPAFAVFNLGRRTGFSPLIAGALAKAAGLELHPTVKAKDHDLCRPSDRKGPKSIARDLSLLDFFVRMGGAMSQADDQPTLVQYYNGMSHVRVWWFINEDLFMVQESGDEGDVRSNCTYLSSGKLASYYAQLGFTVTMGSDDLRKPSEREAYRESFAKSHGASAGQEEESLF